jgi:hypothetical protein
LEIRERNTFPTPTSIEQLEVLQGEWHKIPLDTVENLYKSIPRRILALLLAKDGPPPY